MLLAGRDPFRRTRIHASQTASRDADCGPTRAKCSSKDPACLAVAFRGKGGGSVDRVDVRVAAVRQAGEELRLPGGELSVPRQEVALQDLAAALAAELDQARVGRKTELAPFVEQLVQAPRPAETGRNGRLDEYARGEAAERPDELEGPLVAPEVVAGDERVGLQDGQQGGVVRPLALECIQVLDADVPVGEELPDLLLQCIRSLPAA